MSLVGSVVERTPQGESLTPFPVSADPKTGFPAAMHRSKRQRKSAFRKNMEAARPLRDGAIPAVQSAITSSGQLSDGGATTDNQSSDEDWRPGMEEENARRVANMSAQEREDELAQLGAKFGDLAGLAEVLRRAKESKAAPGRTGEMASEETLPSPSGVHNPLHRVSSPARPVLSRRGSITGNSSRASTPAVRFAQVTPKDVFTYPSAPASPKRAALALEAPPAEGGEDIPKIQWKGKIPESDATHPLSQVVSASPERKSSTSPPELKLSTELPSQASTQSLLKPPTGGIAFPALSPLDDMATPEAIRRQYFPQESANNPSLEWIADLPEIPDTPVTSEYAYLGEKALALDDTRFNLAGTPIPRELGKEMPVHDGLHHNARTSAGKSGSVWVWACKAGVGAVCVGVAAAVSWKAAL